VSTIDELHPDLQSLVGSVIHERYRVDALLGHGGMGAVFKGYHLNLHRGVAIKVVRPEVGRDAGMSARFTREAHSVSRLDHPNCVRVSDFGTTDRGLRYLVMELLEGEELQASLGQPWSADRAIDVAMQILDGLDHAHHCGVVHRDLKPANVFMTVDYRGKTVVKLVDFGIAKLLDEQDPKGATLTREGMVFGTPRYMSPEQATGGKLDARTDLYAVGLLLYEMLAGHPPFRSDDATILLRMHILAPPPELPPTVPPALAAVVMKLLAKSRDDRFASAREAIKALEQVRVGPSPHPVALSPDQATQPGLQPWDSAPTNLMDVSPPVTTKSSKVAPWQPWAAVAGAVMLLLMAFGAWQTAREHGAEPDSASPVVASSVAAPPISLAPSPKPLPRDDFNCSDGRCTCVAGARCTLDCPREGCELGCTKTRSCNLACGAGCRASCVDAAESCEITLGNDGEASCEDTARCRVTCKGACEVQCPNGDCVVTCQADKGRAARRCDDALVCGRAC
jgi:serine/threonine protein kinase